MEVVIVWILFALGVGALAASRGRSFFGFFLLSVVMSPLLGLIIVLVTANLANDAKADALRAEADRKEHERRIEEIRALQPHGTPAPTATRSSTADELRKLADLRAQGVLSDAEFEAQKRRLLAST